MGWDDPILSVRVISTVYNIALLYKFENYVTLITFIHILLIIVSVFTVIHEGGGPRRNPHRR